MSDTKIVAVEFGFGFGFRFGFGFGFGFESESESEFGSALDRAAPRSPSEQIATLLHRWPAFEIIAG